MTWTEEVASHRKALSTSFAVFSRTPHGSLLWVTTVIFAHVVRLGDDITQVVNGAIDAYRVTQTAIIKKSGKAYRNPAGWTRHSGTIEIDLIHPQIARRCSRTKAGLLAELGIDVATLDEDQRIALIHEHAVVDHRGHASADVLTRDMRGAWPGARRVHAARLYDTDTVAQNLSNLAEYAGKFRFRYSRAWNGSKTSFLCDFEAPWREYVRQMYRSIGFKRLLHGNVSTQSGRRGMHIPSVNHRGETPISSGFQLSVTTDLQENNKKTNIKSSNDYTNINESSTNDGNDMRAHEIIDRYIDPTRITDDALRELESALSREGPGLTGDELAIMYGDAEADLKLQTERLQLVKMRAEIDRIEAAAARDRAEAASVPSPHGRHRSSVNSISHPG